MMRPGVGVKPKDRAVIYSDAVSGFTIALSIKTNTGYAKVTWWDGTYEVIDSIHGKNMAPGGMDPTRSGLMKRIYAWKTSDTNSTKKIIIESCNASGNISGYLIYFSCQKKRQSGYDDPTTICKPLIPNQKIKQLDVSTCTNLKVLKCDRNNLTTLGDIKACKQLSTLCCGGNSFASLDVSQIPNLEQLYCNNNYNLNTLTIGTNLKSLRASTSGMTGFASPSGSKLVFLTMKDSSLIGITLDNSPDLAFVNLNTQNETATCSKRNTAALTRVSANNLPKLDFFALNNSTDSSLITSINLNGSGSGTEYPITIGDHVEPRSGWKHQFDLGYATLSTSAINTLYSGLNTVSPNSVNFSAGNLSGYSKSNTSIATAKGYIVY